MTIILSTDKQPRNQLTQQSMMKTNSFDLTSNGGQRLDEGSELQRPQVTGSLNYPSVLTFPYCLAPHATFFFPKIVLGLTCLRMRKHPIAIADRVFQPREELTVYA